MKRLIIILVLAACTPLFGCGAGDSNDHINNVLTPIGSPVNLKVMKSFWEGSSASVSYSSSMVGLDRNGTNYIGTLSATGSGTISYGSQQMTKSMMTTSLTNTTNGATSGGTISNYYLLPTSIYFKSEWSNGRVCTPITTGTSLPLSALVGDQGSFGRTTYDSDTTELTKWKIFGDVNGSSKIVISSYQQISSGYTISSESDTFYINPSGSIYRYDVEIYENGISTIKLTGDMIQRTL